MSMSKQEIFTRVAVHLLRQGQKSLMDSWPSGRCAYRGRNRTRCAVGVLIPDAIYKPAFEGVKVLDSLVAEALVCAGVLPSIGGSEELSLLADLQYIHDVTEVEGWSSKLGHLATIRNLQMPRLDDIDELRWTGPTEVEIELSTTKEGATHE